MIYFYIYLVGIIPSYIFIINANFDTHQKIKLSDLLFFFFVNLLWPGVLFFFLVGFLGKYISKKEIKIPFSKHKTITSNTPIIVNEIDKLKRYIK